MILTEAPTIDDALYCSLKNKSIREEHCKRIDEEDDIDQYSHEEESRNDENEDEELCGEEKFKIV
jgi:hypothetical protein